MFKFVAGITTGWVAARALPAPKDSKDRMKPPTYDEVYTLAQKIKHVVEQTLEKLDKQSSR